MLVPVMIVMGWYGLTTYNQQLNSALTIERLANESMRDKIELEIKRFKTLLYNKGDPLSFLLDKPNSTEALTQINTLLAVIVKREPAVHGVMILSIQGDVIAAVDPGIGFNGDKILSAEEKRFAGEHWDFDKAIDHPEIVIPSFGRTYIGTLIHHNDETVFTIAVPIAKPAKAIFIMEFDAEKFFLVHKHKVHGIGEEKTRDYILDRRGALITKINGGEQKKGELMTHLAIVRAALFNSKWPKDTSYLGVMNQTVYGTLTTIPTLNWTLISEVIAGTITGPIWQSLFKLFLWTLLGIIIFVVFVLRLVDKTLKPIQKASEAIDYIARGNYEFELKPSGIYELDAMSSGILNMTKARQKVEGLLQDKEKEQREMLDSMVDAVISIDEDGKILSFNQAAESLFEYSFDEIIGKNIKRLMPEPYSSEHDGYLQHYIKTGEAHVIGFGREVEGLKKNKETFPMRLFVAKLPKGIDGKQRFIGSCVDLTDIRQQEELLRRSQKMDALGKLTGGIAHDYNNMLGVILGYAEILESRLEDKPDLTGFVDEIRHAGERGAKLTKKLLSFSRKKTSDAEILNLNTVLQDEQHMLEKTLTARIKLIFDFADDVWPVKLDAGEFEDAIVNLSINAMHAIEGHGELTIQTRNERLNEIDAITLQISAGDYVLLSITDTGKGMDDKTKEKIFEPFYSTKGELGTGLGLSQVYGFVERSHGVIKVYSEVGLGSRLTLYFPRYIDEKVKNDNEEVNQDKKSSATSLSGTETILVVDDERGLRNVTSEMLRINGYQVHCAEHGKHALEVLENEEIDLLFSDVIMPEMDGFQLAAIVLKKYPSVKIQLTSGFSDGRHEAMSNDTLYNNLLSKPYHSEALLKKIRELLD